MERRISKIREQIADAQAQDRTLRFVGGSLYDAPETTIPVRWDVLQYLIESRETKP
jgi:hypothetical protein